VSSQLLAAVQYGRFCLQPTLALAVAACTLRPRRSPNASRCTKGAETLLAAA
jgi:hypothetical protein